MPDSTYYFRASRSPRLRRSTNHEIESLCWLIGVAASSWWRPMTALTVSDGVCLCFWFTRDLKFESGKWKCSAQNTYTYVYTTNPSPVNSWEGAIPLQTLFSIVSGNLLFLVEVCLTNHSSGRPQCRALCVHCFISEGDEKIDAVLDSWCFCCLTNTIDVVRWPRLLLFDCCWLSSTPTSKHPPLTLRALLWYQQ
jgi:hypothetical protein